MMLWLIETFDKITGSRYLEACFKIAYRELFQLFYTTPHRAKILTGEIIEIKTGKKIRITVEDELTFFLGLDEERPTLEIAENVLVNNVDEIHPVPWDCEKAKEPKRVLYELCKFSPFVPSDEGLVGGLRG